ncbi:MAG: hypothetical protein AAGG48_23365 [Planctomycetota bacterium]
MKMASNPYDPPPPVSDGIVTPERTRESLASLIRAFLASEITAFQFDEQLDAYGGADDAIVRHVVDAVWCHYDDCTDHLVCLSKAEWDYFQRLLLVLSSDCCIETQSKRRWSIKQLIAAVSLGFFTVIAMLSGWGQHLLVLSIPFGIVSIALSLWRTQDERTLDPYAPIIFPFATFFDLATAYHSSDFRMTRYPKHIGTRRIRSPFMDAFWQCLAYTIWLILSPFPLLFQMFPESKSEIRIRAA